jgi:plastocyanin
LAVVLAAFCVTAILGTGIALAASETIQAGPSESFSKATYATDQGVVVQFQDLGGTHNVTAKQTGPDGGALFRSPTISGGTTGVQGTQYLTPGNYAFFCTVHPTTMNGTLQVTGAGTAQPRPQATLTFKSRNLSKAIKKGVTVGINMSAKVDDVDLTLKLGKKVIGQAKDLSLAAGPQFAQVKLSKAGKGKLRARDTAKLTATAAIPFGSPASVKAKFS